MNFTADDIERLNQRFEQQTAGEILRWAWKNFQPSIVASSSFQTQSVALLHLISQNCPQMPILFLDTGFHFPETLAFRDDLEALLQLNIQTVRRAQAGVEPLYMRDPDLCCRLHKVEPLARALRGQAAWITGIRRDQTQHRQEIPILQRRADGILKIHPLATWSKRDLWAYIDEHNLPAHPLFNQGYASIGCAPCTRPVFAGQDERAGRWAGRNKTECGLHTAMAVDVSESTEEQGG